MSKKMTVISIILVISMLLSYFAPFSISNAATTETFNTNLYKAIKASLIKDGYGFSYDDAKNKITVEDISKIKVLDLSNGEIDDLTGLGTFSAVKELDLSGNLLTQDSNLGEINSMSLKKLDLSSNAIEDASDISGLNNISNLNLHNQKFNKTVVFKSGKDNQDEVAYFILPQIFEYAGRIKASWFKDEVHSGNSNLKIAWTKSDLNNLKIAIQKGSINNEVFLSYTGYIKLPILVDDSENVLFNTEINLNFVVDDDDYEGIVFKDKNLYDAVKAQLKQYQSINSDLTTYTSRGNLYSAAYDDALTLVISKSDLDNRITSLKVENKKVKDITGLEHFVGLESDLSLLGNKIENLEKIVELYNNKQTRSQELKQEVNDLVSLIKSKIDLVDAKREEKKATQSEIDRLEEEEVSFATRRQTINEKIEEIEGLITQANQNIDEAQGKIDAANNTINELTSQREVYEGTGEESIKENYGYALKKQQAETDLNTAQSNLDTARLQLEEAKERAEEEVSGYNSAISDMEGRIRELLLLINSINNSEDPDDLYNLSLYREEKRALEENLAFIHDERIQYIELATSAAEMLVTTREGELQTAENNFREATEKYNEEYQNYLNILNNINEVENNKAESENLLNDLVNNVKPGYNNQIEQQHALLDAVDAEKAETDRKIEVLQGNINEIQSRIDEVLEELESVLDGLYNKYTRSYVLTKTTTNDIPNSISGLSDERLTTLINDQINKLTSMESTFTADEKAYIINAFGIPTTDIDGNAIENPISTYFSNKEMTSSEARNVYSKLVNLSAAIISLNNCVSYNYFEPLKSSYIVEHDNDTSSIKDKLYIITTESNRDAILTEIGDDTFEEYSRISSIPDMHYIEAMGRKIANSTVDDVDALVKLPELLSLDASINRLKNVDYLSEITTLQELYLGSNEMTDITSFNWANMSNLSKIDLSFNSLKNVKPLENAPHLSYIDVSDNLIEVFDFDIGSMYSFRENGSIDLLDFSGNAIADVEPVINQLDVLARQTGSEIGRIFDNFNIRFRRQKLYMDLGEVLVGNLKYIDMPPIFSQCEEIMPEKTEFDITSFDGNVTSDGTEAIIRINTLGKNQGVVKIVNQNGSSYPFAYGTTLTIDYNVVTELSGDDDSEVDVPGTDTSDTTDTTDTSTTSDTSSTTDTTDTTDTSSTSDTTDTTDTSTTSDTTDTTDTTDTSTTGDTSSTADTTDTSSTSDTTDTSSTTPSSVDINSKYAVDGDTITISPKTEVADFKDDVVNSNYTIILKKENIDGTVSNVDSGYVGTGTILVVLDSNGNAIDAYEIVAKGDVNGDGLANATDSYLIKAHRAEALTLSALYREAADINDDDNIDAVDSRLLLFYRAEVAGYEL